MKITEEEAKQTMIVYVLELCVPYEPGEVIAVYSDPVEAIKHQEDFNKDQNFMGCEIREMELLDTFNENN